MKAFVEKLFEEMELSLKEVAKETSSEIQKAEKSGRAVHAILLKLKLFMGGYQFADSTEEIKFFKEYKPLFYKELIFYSELTYIESRRPIGKKELIKSYYHHVMDQIQDFFARNHQLYIYHQLDRSDQDEQLFLRNSLPVSFIPDYSFDFDPEFSTVNSSKLAKIMAYESLIEYMQEQLIKLELGLGKSGDKNSNHEWTDSKSALIELAYALHSRGSVNHGKSDVKMIISILEKIFHVKVGNFYRTFQSMRGRKKGRTIFLDGLKESLVKRMDDTDMGYQ
ncbi:RteC domain-containing protein [Algoriphagus sp. AGSA1]|uniref:RteC protein n=1 Tax=Algoriphagus yeomjeoni TaxID=291403 RepID=A0A327P712_9BACT|nr:MULTISPECIES: RteC domain-containing protein [Algoriphagus]MCE7053675.1 RteC domain-containing protein [Algoriphagus sp. AGSA1]RAI88055.1 RteC protein [Algoriphagus yeomjeoni]|tara:strand:- start:884 stop:1723 length:840 start_codon:yes stop_codon:yes gene_type:complete